MDPQSRTAEEIIAELATAAHGIVTRAELVAADPSRTQIRNRVRKGLLIPEYPGVYRAGHRARSRESDYMAAIKAADGVLYNQAAGHLLATLKSPGWPQPEVMTASARDPKGLKPKHVRRIDPRDVTEIRHPVHDRPGHACPLGRDAERRGAGQGRPSGARHLPRRPAAHRGRAEAPPQRQGRREATRDRIRRHQGPALLLGEGLH